MGKCFIKWRSRDISEEEISTLPSIQQGLQQTTLIWKWWQFSNTALTYLWADSDANTLVAIFAHVSSLVSSLWIPLSYSNLNLPMCCGCRVCPGCVCLYTSKKSKGQSWPQHKAFPPCTCEQSECMYQKKGLWWCKHDCPFVYFDLFHFGFNRLMHAFREILLSATDGIRLTSIVWETFQVDTFCVNYGVQERSKYL